MSSIIVHTDRGIPTLPVSKGLLSTEHYFMVWDDKLGTGEALTGAVWTCEPADFYTVADSEIQTDVTLEGTEYAYVAAVQLSGGTAGETARVICTATITGGTVSPRTMVRSFNLACKAL